MKIILTFLLIVLITNFVIATEQEKERLLYGSDTCLIIETPLDSIFGQGRSKMFDIEKTSLWRGYVGIWQIRDSNLYLIDIKAKQNGKELNFIDVFGGKKELEIKWYSGMLTIIGSTKYYPLNPYDKHKSNIELKVKDGKVMNIRDIKNQNIDEYLRSKTINKNRKGKKSAPKKKY